MVRLCSLGLNLIESPAGRIADRPRSPSLRSAGAQVRPAHGLAEVFASSASAPSRSYPALLRRASPARVRRMLRTSVTRPAVLLEIEPSCCGFTTKTTDIAPSRVPDALGARQFLYRTRSRSSGFASIPWSTGQPPLAACLALLINIARVSHRSDLQPRRPLRHQ
jgi:hypothetical protein